LQEIRDNGVLLAVYGNCDLMPPGQFFWEGQESPIQWGTQNLDVGKEVQPHVHKMRDRCFRSKTIEAFIVLSGRLQADLYNLARERVLRLVLEPGSFLITYDGGHGFKSLGDSTKFLEVKLGPFTSVEDDKEKF